MARPPPLPRRLRVKPPPLPRPRTWRFHRPAELRKFKNLLFAARVMVEGAYAGRHKSPFRGASPEFIEYRRYDPGDPIDAIDWKAYARSDRFYIRLTEKETDMNCYLLLDASASMGYAGPLRRKLRGERPMSKLEYASYLGAALAYLMIKQGDRVSFTVFDEVLRDHVRSGGTFPHLYGILRSMERLKARGQTSLPDVLHRVAPLVPRRGLLIVLSDFYNDPVEIFRALNQYRHRNFEIILFHILHEQEHVLPELENVRFVDAETDEELTCSPNDIREVYDRDMAEFIDTMRTFSRARNIDYNLLDTQTPYDEMLYAYMMRRRAIRK